MIGFVFRAALAAVGLWLATLWLPGLRIDGPGTLLLAAVLLGLVNAIVRPIAIILTLPVTIVTLGLFLLVINGAMVALVAQLLDGMHVDGFKTAVLAALIVSVTGWLGSWFIGPRGRIEIIRR
jgi:putative membrane protein